MPELASLTAADIARLAGVTRATVSNWRRRHRRLPRAVGRDGCQPRLRQGQGGSLAGRRGALPELPPEERLWHAVLEARNGETDLGRAAVRRA